MTRIKSRLIATAAAVATSISTFAGAEAALARTAATNDIWVPGFALKTASSGAHQGVGNLTLYGAAPWNNAGALLMTRVNGKDVALRTFTTTSNGGFALKVKVGLLTGVRTFWVQRGLLRSLPAHVKVFPATVAVQSPMTFNVVGRSNPIAHGYISSRANGVQVMLNRWYQNRWVPVRYVMTTNGGRWAFGLNPGYGVSGWMVSYRTPNNPGFVVRTNSMVMVRKAARIISPYAPHTNIHYTKSQQVIVTVPTSRYRGAYHRYEWQGIYIGWVRVGHTGVGAGFGKNGVVPAARRRQDTNTTPGGVFPLLYTFGTGNPGVKPGQTYRTINKCSWWIQMKSAPDYNRWRQYCGSLSKSANEYLPDYASQYRQSVVIGYNYVNRIRSGGGSGAGIFLHYGTTWTAGCVALNSRAELTSVVRWLDPAKKPMIRIATL